MQGVALTVDLPDPDKASGLSLVTAVSDDFDAALRDVCDPTVIQRIYIAEIHYREDTPGHYLLVLDAEDADDATFHGAVEAIADRLADEFPQDAVVDLIRFRTDNPVCQMIMEIDGAAPIYRAVTPAND
jgi:hypothetical protein